MVFWNMNGFFLASKDISHAQTIYVSWQRVLFIEIEQAQCLKCAFLSSCAAQNYFSIHVWELLVEISCLNSKLMINSFIFIAFESEIWKFDAPV